MKRAFITAIIVWETRNMARGSLRRGCATLGVMTMLSASSVGGYAWAAPEYHPIVPSMEGTTVTLTGHDLTIEQLIAVARYGARVQYGPGVVEHASNALGLLLEADAEGADGINRGYGVHREDEKKQERSIRPMLGAGRCRKSATKSWCVPHFDCGQHPGLCRCHTPRNRRCCSIC